MLPKVKMPDLNPKRNMFSGATSQSWPYPQRQMLTGGAQQGWQYPQRQMLTGETNPTWPRPQREMTTGIPSANWARPQREMTAGAPSANWASPQREMMGGAQSQNPYFQPNVTPTTISAPASQPYKPRYEPGSQIGSLISKIGQYLKPQEAFSQTMPYEQFANPYRELGRQFIQSTLRPQFDAYTLNPFKEQWGNQSAASGRAQMGNAPALYQRMLNQTMQPYYDQESQARNAYENMARQFYEMEIPNYYSSPTSFNNIGM